MRIIALVRYAGGFLTLAEADRYTAARLSERPSPSPGPDRRKEVDLLEFEPLDQFQQRRKKLSEIEALGHSAYPRKFAWTHTARQIGEQFETRTAEQLTADPVNVRVAGRIIALRPHGKAAFAHVTGD